MRVGYIVIFTSKRTPLNDDGYQDVAANLEQEVKKIPGFLNMQSIRDADRNGITISYWENKDGIMAWKKNREHATAKVRAQNWYETFDVKIWKIEDSWNP
jgi:heme-degrading monooxygenase HmoA